MLSECIFFTDFNDETMRFIFVKKRYMPVVIFMKINHNLCSETFAFNYM